MKSNRKSVSAIHTLLARQFPERSYHIFHSDEPFRKDDKAVKELTAGRETIFYKVYAPDKKGGKQTVRWADAKSAFYPFTKAVILFNNSDMTVLQDNEPRH